MTLKLKITTKKPKEIEKALDKFQDGIMKRGQGVIFSTYQKVKDDEFLLNINYGLENRGSNWIVKREIESTLRKLDSKIKIE